VGPAVLLALLVVAEPAVAPRLEASGCLACHSIDGARRAGPPLSGLLGRTRVVWRDGVRSERVADRAYLADSIRNPNLETVDGHPPSSMPDFGLDEASIAALVEEIAALPARRGGEGSLALYAASGLAFVLFHLGLSFWPVRRRLVDGLGSSGFLWLYSAAVSVPLGGLVWLWSSAPFVPVWTPPDATRWIPILGMPIVAVLSAAGMMTPGPLKMDWSGNPIGEAQAIGVFRLTRHPGLFSTALWAALHLAANGDAASIVLFGSFLALCLIGPFHIESRYRRRFGEAWTRLDSTSAILPLHAILTGRASWRDAAPGWPATLVGLGSYAALLLGHAWLFGADPLGR
jgi:uncharacterized membrane protein